MKKIKFNLSTGGNEQLSREQLRNILGGDDVPASEDCKTIGQPCFVGNMGSGIKCCPGLVCASYWCQELTL